MITDFIIHPRFVQGLAQHLLGCEWKRFQHRPSAQQLHVFLGTLAYHCLKAGTRVFTHDMVSGMPGFDHVDNFKRILSLFCISETAEGYAFDHECFLWWFAAEFMRGYGQTLTDEERERLAPEFKVFFEGL